jgi:hypothetical protein
MITRQTISMTLIGLAGLFITIITGWLIYSWSVTHHSDRVQGTVVQLLERHYDDTVFCPVFVFRDSSGTEHRVQSSVGSNPPRFPIGSKLSVLYSPANPEDAQIEDHFFLWTAPLIFFGFSVLCGSAGFIIGRRPEKRGYEIR